MAISSSVPETSKAMADVRGETPSDPVLLRRFRDARDEAAFVQLVNRYGEMVFAVALRILRDRHAAEDVFQATFLVLARDARKVRRPESLASWLHGIALRMAKKSLKRRQRDRTLETDMEPFVEEPLLEEMSLLFQRQLLDEELSKLPESYREPLILHFLRGKTYEETAEALGVSVGAIEGRLKRGKRELQLRLMRRGVGIGVAIAAIHWSQSAAHAAVQPTLVSAAVHGGMAIAQGTSFGPICSSEAVHLAAKETAMFTTAKVTATVCGLLAATSLGWAVHAGLTGAGEGPIRKADGVHELALSAQGHGSSTILAQIDTPASAVDGTPVDIVNPSQTPPPAQAAETTEKTREPETARQKPDQPEILAVEPELVAVKSRGTLAAALSGLKGSLTIISIPGENRFLVRGSQEDVARFVDAIRQVEQQSQTASGDPAAGAVGNAPEVPSSAARDKIPVLTDASKSEQKIEEELQKQTNMEFPGNPLSDALNVVEQAHGIPIHVDEKALAEAGVTSGTEVRTVISGVPLESALNLLLEDVGGVELRYVIQDDVMKITTVEKADAIHEVRVYDVRPLGLTDPAPIVSLVQDMTEAPWFDVDGIGGTIAYIDGKLVVRQSRRAHRQIEQILNMLLASSSPAAATGSTMPEWLPKPNFNGAVESTRDAGKGPGSRGGGGSGGGSF